MVARPALHVVSLFTGAGGLDLGLEAAGFETCAAIEFAPNACATLRANRHWPVLEGDIHAIASSTIVETSGRRIGETDLLAGGPPCQPFSKSAYWALGDTKRLADPRADTLSAYMRVLKDLRPRVFLLENVQGLLYRGKDEGMQLLARTVEEINAACGTRYSFNWAVLNTADYGVPQTRERVFIVGARDGRRFRFPEPTHQDPASVEVGLFGSASEPWMTAWDAIGDLEDTPADGLEVGGTWGDLLPSIPEGENYLFHTDRGGGLHLFGWRRRYWSFLLKLGKSRPAWTIQAQPGSAIGPFHWKNRRLSIAELIRIQTFPDDFRVLGGRTEVQRQIGNAVPSLMTEILGREIRAQLLDSPIRAGTPLKLMPMRREPVPRPEPLGPVPRKYRKFIGDHAAHPGTGKGHLVRAATT